MLYDANASDSNPSVARTRPIACATMADLAATTDVAIILSNNGTAVHNVNINAKHNPFDPGTHSGDVHPAQSMTVTVNLRPETGTFTATFPVTSRPGWWAP